MKGDLLASKKSKPIRYTYSIPLVDYRSLSARSAPLPMGSHRLAHRLNGDAGELPFVPHLGELQRLKAGGFTLPNGPRVTVSAKRLLRLASEIPEAAVNVVRSNLIDRRLVIEPDSVSMQLQLRGSWASPTVPTPMYLHRLDTSILVTLLDVTTDVASLAKCGQAAARELTRLTEFQAPNSGTEIKAGRPILIAQCQIGSLTDVTYLEKLSRVRLPYGLLYKVPHRTVELYVVTTKHAPRAEDPMPAVLSLLHANLSALERLTSDDSPSIKALPANSLRQARMNRLTLQRRMELPSAKASWVPRLVRFYRTVTDGILDDLEVRLEAADEQMRAAATQISRTEIIMGDKFENISNSQIVNRSTNGRILGSSEVVDPTRQLQQPLSLINRRPRSSGSHTGPSKSVWDVFISHASEDKAAVARPLEALLTGHGASVWLDETELKIGDSLRRRIDAGIAGSRFAILIVSPNFFAKNWTQYELDGIVTRSVTDEQNILPIWHGVSHAEVTKFSPSLADKVARSTEFYSIDQIAAEIAEVILDA